MAAVLSPALVDLGFDEFSPDNVEEQLPKIINTILEDTYNPNFLQLMTFMLGQLASQFEIEMLDLKLLQHVLPPTRSAFENCLLGVGNLLGESDDMEEETAISISKSLQACLDILSGYGELLEVLSKDAVQAQHVRSLNDNLPPILLEAFSHCKDSESCYGVYFEESTTILTAFFKKSYEIQMKYYKALEEKIIFSSSFAEDLPCLINVLESIQRTTEIVVSLDIKTCVDQWKLYVRLYSKHISNLKTRIDLSQPLSLLTSNVQKILLELTNSNQDITEKHQLKLLKVGNFLLKMILKLCELSECRFREGMKDLVELLLLLHSCTKTYDLNDELKEEVRRFICVGSAPLLALLFKEEDFFKAYNNIRNNHAELTAVSKVGLVFLSLTIMRTVVERKAPPFWSELPMIELVVDLYESCGVMIDMNSHFEGNDAYTSIISTCAAFMIATADEFSFAQLESYLVSKLFNSKIHASVFVCDYICLIGRLTSDNYCLHLTTYLCEALNRWPCLWRHRPEYNTIGTLLHRLWKLLSQKSRDALTVTYSLEESPHVHVWLNGSAVYAQAILKKYDSFNRLPSPSSFNDLMDSSPPEIDYEIDPSDYELVSKTFDHVKNVISFVKNHKNNRNNEMWCLKLLLYSLKLLTPLVSTTPAEIIVEVLDNLSDLMGSSKDKVQLLVFMFLSRSAVNLGNISKSNATVAHALTTLLLKLVESEDKIVASSTLCIWKTIENPQLKDTVAMDSNLADRYSSIMDAHHLTSNNSANTTFSTVMNALPEPAHSCSRHDEPATDTDVPPAKKFKGDSAIVPSDLQITEIVQRLQQDAALLKNACSQLGISHQTKVQLDAVIKDLTAVHSDVS